MLKHAVVVADGAREIIRIPFATIKGESILERICVLEDLRDRLPQIMFAVSSGHVVYVGTKTVRFKALVATTPPEVRAC
jgi:hypothetical protein